MRFGSHKASEVIPKTKEGQNKKGLKKLWQLEHENGLILQKDNKSFFSLLRTPYITLHLIVWRLKHGSQKPQSDETVLFYTRKGT